MVQRGRRVGGVAALAALALAVAGVAPARAAQRTITIGTTLALTGKFEGFYGVTDKFVKAWEQVVNEQGGVAVKDQGGKLPVKVIYYDDKSDPKTSVKWYEKLATDDKVDFFLGPPASPIAYAATAVAEKYQIPMVLTPSNDPKIFQRGYKWIQAAIDEGGNWSVPYFEMQKKLGKAKSIAFVTEDSLWALGIVGGAVKNAQAAGMKVVFEQKAPPDLEDFTPTIARLKAENPDLVFVPAFAPFAVRFAKQALELGLKPRAYHFTAGSTVGFRGPIGPKADFMTGEAYWVPGLRVGNWQRLEEVTKRTKIDLLEWTYVPILGYGLEVLQAGIEKAGTLDRAKVMQAIQEVEFTTTGGKYKARGNGIGSLNPFPIQIQKGKVVAIWPPEGATGEYIYPAPW